MTEQNLLHQALRENEAHHLSNRRAWPPPVAKTFVCPCAYGEAERPCTVCHGADYLTEAQHGECINPLEGLDHYSRKARFLAELQGVAWDGWCAVVRFFARLVGTERL